MPPKNAIHKLPVFEPENLDTSLRSAIDSMGEGFALFGPDDRLVFCNEAYLRFQPLDKAFIQPGILFEEIIRENIKRGNVAVAAGDEEAYIKKRLKQHRNPEGPIYRRMSDGSSFILNECRTPDGSTLLTTNNVTELREIENELRESKAMLNDTLESISDGVALFGKDDRMIFCNTAYRENLSKLSDVLVPGVLFEDIVRAATERAFAPGNKKEQKKTISRRMEEHRKRVPSVNFYPETGESVIIQEYETSDGGTFLVRANITELKQAERALRESDQRLKTIIDAVPSIITVKDKDSRYIYSNKYQREFFGLNEKELLGETPKIISPEHAKKVRKLDKTVIKTGENLPPYDYSIENAKGELRHLMITKAPLRGISDEIVGIITACLDITERKELEKQAEKDHDRLMDAMESIDGGVALFDKNDRFVFCNSTYREKLKEIDHVLIPGSTYKEILRAYADKGLNTETQNDPEKYVRERFKRHKKLEPSTVQIEKTGEWIMLREYRTSDGGTLIVRTDMTDRIRAEEALKESETALKASEERLRDITDAALDFFWEMGPDFRFTFVSEKFFSNSEIPPEQIIGMTRQEFVGPETINKNPEAWKEHQDDMDNRRAFRNFEFSRHFDDGKHHYFSVSGKPFFDKDGNFMGYRGASTDVTEYRRTERELTHHKKMDSLGYLAGGMAHNLNNMLLPILILGQMTKDNLGEESPDFQNLEIICRAAANAKELVDRISGFSRQQGWERKSADIYEVIREGLSLIAAIVPSRITLKEDLDRNTGTVFLDPAQTETVLINLIANAVDAMGGKKGTLTVTLNKALVEEAGENSITGLAGGHYAKLSVTDTGHGMDDETLHKIFDPFFTTKGAQKGTGLGLSTAFGTIHKHGGTIRASSSLGKGTTFDIYLPLEKKD